MFTSGISKSEDGESSNTSSDWACVSECSVATYDPFEQQPGNRSAASGAQLGQASSCPVTLSLAELLPTTPQIGSQGQASCVGGDGGHAQPREHCLPVNLDGLVLTSPPPWMKVEQVGSVPRGMEESDEVDFVAVSWSCVAEADPDNLECDSEADAGEEHVEPPASAKKAKKKKPRLGKKQRKKKRLILEQGALASIAESTANSGAEVAETETTTDIQLSQARHMSTTHGQAGKEREGPCGFCGCRLQCTGAYVWEALARALVAWKECPVKHQKLSFCGFGKCHLNNCCSYSFSPDHALTLASAI